MQVLNSVTLSKQEVSRFVAVPNAKAYPLRPWLMKSYKKPSQSHELEFNESMQQLMNIKDTAFKRLFARWRILHRKFDTDLQTSINICNACCALHNLCEQRNEQYLDSWNSSVDVQNLDATAATGNEKDDEIALKMRDILAKHIRSKEK